MPAASTPKLLRLPEVVSRTGLSRSSLYARIATGQFPRPVDLGTSHAVAWVENEVDTWIGERIARRDSGERAQTHAETAARAEHRPLRKPGGSNATGQKIAR